MKLLPHITLLAVLAGLLGGCAQPSAPLEPVAQNFSFDKITLNFTQKHYPSTKQYQSKESVEKKFNEALMLNLKTNNTLNQASIDKIVITIDYRRVFAGEDMPFQSMRSDTIGTPVLGYDLKVIRSEKVLRHLHYTNLMYNPGILGNLKTIAMMNTDDSHENSAIEALSIEICEKIKQLK